MRILKFGTVGHEQHTEGTKVEAQNLRALKDKF